MRVMKTMAMILRWSSRMIKLVLIQNRGSETNLLGDGDGDEKNEEDV